MVSVTATPSDSATQHRAALTQAPVKALDPDGLSVICGGTVCFAVATVVLWALSGDLAAAGAMWRLWVAAAGTAMGAIGLALTLTLGRRRRAARQPLAEDQGGAD